MNKKLHPISLAVMTLLAGIALAANAQEVRHSYIVQLAGAPVASYDGGVAGLPATKPAAGTRLDISATDVQNYMAYLGKKQDDVLATINPANVTYRYDVVLNGFAAMLTDAEVRALKKNTGVLSIQADTIQQLHTSNTPTFLGLDQAGGLWAKAGGKGAAGEGMIIAMMDSGVWPEDINFADKVDANGRPTHDPSGTLAYGPPPAKWRNYAHTGVDNLPNGCQVKAGITAANCNNKLIGIRSYTFTNLNTNDFNSGRDGTQEGSGGHGSHTLSTAGGNAGVPAVINGIDLGLLSGIAPRARLAMYKVCWTGTTATNGGCSSTNSVAAINQAVKDGVDVINYSIGPTAGGGTLSDATEVAFLNASNAGVFVATSAGNAGPTTGPAANLGPWHATVAASTHNRIIGATVSLDNGAQYIGASLNAAALPAAALIDARRAGVVAYESLSAPDQMARRLCYTDADRVATANFPGFPAGTTASSLAALDPDLVTDKVVICDRGSNARVNKSAAVAAAHGIGMVLADNGAGLVSELHSVPTVHVTLLDGNQIKAYAAAAEMPTAAMSAAATRYDMPAPIMAGFSSRGPNVADNNLLKPDFTAPGVDIAAAFTPSATAAEVTAIKAGGSASNTAVGIISGTSMASPHIAGLAALLKQLHPTWSPAMIKSAMMTTARDTVDDGVTVGLPWSATASANGMKPWAQGAGHVTPNLATDPGLVYDAGVLDYVRLSCGWTAPNLQIYTAATCNAYGSIKSTALNLPSITSGSVMGVQTLTRTVTNVSASSSTYRSTISVDGFDAEVTPSTFTIGPGAKQIFTVKLTRTSTPLDTWAHGNLTWEDDAGHTVRSPISVRGTAMSVPSLVYSEAVSGSKIFTIGTGFAGPMSVDKAGLKAAIRTTNTLVGNNTGSASVICKANNSAAVKVTDVVIPADTYVARFSLLNSETTGGKIAGGEDDLDLLIMDAAGTALAGSLNGGSNETVTWTNPAAGTYKACVISYDTEQRPNTTYTLSTWAVSKADVGGNFKVLVPATAYVGGTASVGMSWSGLATGQRYLGAATFKVDGVAQGLTLVEVHTNDPVPVGVNSKPVATIAE